MHLDALWRPRHRTRRSRRRFLATRSLQGCGDDTHSTARPLAPPGARGRQMSTPQCWWRSKSRLLREGAETPQRRPFPILRRCGWLSRSCRNQGGMGQWPKDHGPVARSPGALDDTGSAPESDIWVADLTDHGPRLLQTRNPRRESRTFGGGLSPPDRVGPFPGSRCGPYIAARRRRPTLRATRLLLRLLHGRPDSRASMSIWRPECHTNICRLPMPTRHRRPGKRPSHRLDMS